MNPTEPPEDPPPGAAAPPRPPRLQRLLRVVQALLMGLVLLLVVQQVMQHHRATHKVLVIHSYNTDLPWVGDVDQGIDRGLAGQPLRVQVRRHYMNLLNHPDCNHFRLAAQDARLAIEDWQPDAVVLVDDLAQALVGFAHLRWNDGAPVEQVRQGIVAQLTGQRCPSQDAAYFGLDQPAPAGRQRPLFFAGVNGDVERYGYPHASQVSGIFEHKNYAALAETLNAVNAASPQRAVAVQLLNDASPTALSENPLYAAASWGGLRWLPPRNVQTFAQWQAAVQQAAAAQAMLLIANYQNVRDARGRLVPGDELVSWTERHSRYPALGAGTNYVADGGLMTLAISGTEQGQAAMEMVAGYLATGQMPPQRTARQFLVGMNPALVRKRGLQLPAVYEAFAREAGRFIEVSEHVYRDAASAGARQ
jgi:hypothetical protein